MEVTGSHFAGVYDLDEGVLIEERRVWRGRDFESTLFYPFGVSFRYSNVQYDFTPLSADCDLQSCK